MHKLSYKTGKHSRRSQLSPKLNIKHECRSDFSPILAGVDEDHVHSPLAH